MTYDSQKGIGGNKWFFAYRMCPKHLVQIIKQSTHENP